jgi:phage regulator Rha-like protein
MQKSLPAPAAAIAGKSGMTIPPTRRPAPVEMIGRRIYLIRGQKVMLDSDLAELYRVETKALNRAVKRNAARFPVDFMFRLTETEATSLRCQIGTSNDSRGGRRYLPYAFTEHGVAMLSSVLNSERAVQMNIMIIRAFVKLREMIASHKDLARRMERLENTQKDHSAVLTIVVNDIQNLEKKVMKEIKSLEATRRRKPRFGFVAAQR